MKRTVVRFSLALALVAVVALLSFALAAPQEAAADAQFTHPWVVFVSNNVLATERGLWDDIAAGAPAGEAGLLWFVNNQPVDESVGYKTTHVAISTSTFRNLSVRAALNDGAIFRVGYALNNPAAACVYPPALTWLAAEADGLYRVKTFPLPLQGTVRAICIVLTDNPDGVATGRSNVLIDYIALRNAAGGVGWVEHFSGAGPF
jgi:hypothetical protein